MINNVSHINYLSIDVEGAEFEVIKSINFDKVFIDIIGFENNYNDTSIPIVKYLEQNNYIVITISSDIFMINKDSIFNDKKYLLADGVSSYAYGSSQIFPSSPE